jgi:hypothetical protein
MINRCHNNKLFIKMTNEAKPLDIEFHSISNASERTRVLSKPFFMVLYCHPWGYRSCTIVDTFGMKYRMRTNVLTKKENVFDLRKMSDEPVEVWWPEFKEIVGVLSKVFDSKLVNVPPEPCEYFEELKTLASKITKKPIFDHFDTGMHDGEIFKCVLFVDNEQWTIEYHGDVATKNIYPEINDFVSMIYKTLKINILEENYDHHTILNCKKNHPLVIVSQEFLLHKPHTMDCKNTCVCGTCHKFCDKCSQHGGYICNRCGAHEKTAESYHCRSCGYDLCPTCVKKEIDKQNISV